MMAWIVGFLDDSADGVDGEGAESGGRPVDDGSADGESGLI